MQILYRYHPKEYVGMKSLESSIGPMLIVHDGSLGLDAPFHARITIWQNKEKKSKRKNLKKKQKQNKAQTRASHARIAIAISNKNSKNRIQEIRTKQNKSKSQAKAIHRKPVP